MSFMNVKDAQEAFLLERLQFRLRDKAFVILVTPTGAPQGHESVEIVGVVGITAEGGPIYQCKKPSGDLGKFDGNQLHTAKELIEKPGGGLTAYGTWLTQQQEELRARAIRPPGPPVPVTLAIRLGA